MQNLFSILTPLSLPFPVNLLTGICIAGPHNGPLSDDSLGSPRGLSIAAVCSAAEGPELTLPGWSGGGGGVLGAKSEGAQAHTSRGLVPAESHRTCLLPPAVSCYNTREVNTTEEATLITSMSWNPPKAQASGANLASRSGVGADSSALGSCHLPIQHVRQPSLSMAHLSPQSSPWACPICHFALSLLASPALCLLGPQMPWSPLVTLFLQHITHLVC